MCANPQALRADLDQLSIEELENTVSYVSRVRIQERSAERFDLTSIATMASLIVLGIVLAFVSPTSAWGPPMGAALVGLVAYAIPRFREYRHDRKVSDQIIEVANAVIASKEGK